MREIEVKLRVKDLGALKRRVIERGCVLSAPIHQHDVIYSRIGSTDEWETSKEGQIVLRLRNEDGVTGFNLKQQLSNELDNLEYETVVEQPGAIRGILTVLGYAPQVEVKKVRQRGKLGEYEICLDEVEKLGSFVELEKLTDADVNISQIQEDLLLTLESLGLSRTDQEFTGYDTQIYNLQTK